MKKWENPKLMILGVENTKTMDTFGSDSSNGNDKPGERPLNCYCKEINGHDHNAQGWIESCPCCAGVPKAS